MDGYVGRRPSKLLSSFALREFDGKHLFARRCKAAAELLNVCRNCTERVMIVDETQSRSHVTHQAEAPRTLRSLKAYFSNCISSILEDVGIGISVGMLRDTERPYAECLVQL